MSWQNIGSEKNKPWEFLKQSGDQYRDIKVELYDEDAGASDDFIGRGVIALTRITGQSQDIQIRLSDDKGKDAGTVRIRIYFVQDRRQSSRGTGYGVQNIERAAGKFVVQPLSANLLKDNDWMGSQDPYCRVSVNGVQKQTRPHSGGGKKP